MQFHNRGGKSLQNSTGKTLSQKNEHTKYVKKMLKLFQKEAKMPKIAQKNAKLLKTT